jgi:hypothetical protein
MTKSFSTIAAASFVAALVMAWPAPRVEAGTPSAGTVPSVENAAAATACTHRAWPYQGQGCASDFDARWRGEPRKVRIVTTDRLN